MTDQFEWWLSLNEPETKTPIRLQRCPFCGGMPKYRYVKLPNRPGGRICNRHQIWCQTPGCYTMAATNQLYHTVRDTKKLWNQCVEKWREQFIQSL